MFRFQHEILRFLDGTDQRYRDSAGPLYSWVIRLDQLDENELAAMETFFLENQGAFGTFAFTDPWSGQVFTNCSLAADNMDLISVAEMQSKTSLTIIQNPR
ncbi:MAG: DUF2460 domain-containing protein [Acidobacteriia bacterium]|nr:DUF2460 domain-containing protein [Terriglobia bacterium]